MARRLNCDVASQSLHMNCPSCKQSQECLSRHENTVFRQIVSRMIRGRGQTNAISMSLVFEGDRLRVGSVGHTDYLPLGAFHCYWSVGVRDGNNGPSTHLVTHLPHLLG